MLGRVAMQRHLVYVTVSVLCLLGGVYGSCTRRQFEQCLALLQGGKVLNFDDLYDVMKVRPSDDIQDMCTEYEGARECVDDLLEDCTDQPRIISAMILGHVGYVCDTLPEYERYTRCMSSVTGNLCFPASMRSLLQGDNVCQKLDQTRACRVTLFSEQCGRDAGVWIERVMKHGLMRWGELHQCQFQYQDSGADCLFASNTAFIMTTLMGVLIRVCLT